MENSLQPGTPARDGFLFAADWAPHRRTWMCWPCRAESWGGAEAMLSGTQATARIARAISTFEPVTMAARHEDAAAAKLATSGKAQVFETALDDSCARDTGPTFLRGPAGGRGAVQWRFNGWGNKYADFAHDANLATRMANAAELRIYDGPLVCEGGAIDTDGEGTLITTEQCLLNPNRNPGLSRHEVEQRLAQYTGARRIVWLGGAFSDMQTDGHVDNFARFVAPGRVLVGIPSSPSLPDAELVKEAIRRLREARDVHGRPIEVIEIVQPRRVRFDWRGHVLQTSYVSFYLANGGIVMPAFDDPHDEKAQTVLADLFPGRDILQVEVLDLLQGGGGIHRIALGEPAAP
ncbi:MAG TPA: agmatine deiminase family protein [Rhizomicrobium sp.]|nr:agmatine deiminase family protein [Rhizomicrobium sp.]